MRRLLVLAFILALPATSWAQCTGGTNGTAQTPSYLATNEFQNGQAAGSITPNCMRDLIASMVARTGNTSSFALPTSPTGLSSGSLWVNGTVLSVVP